MNKRKFLIGNLKPAGYEEKTMSCKDCDEYNEGQKGVAYFRWGTANIGLMACPKHLKEVMDVLRKHQEE